MRQKRSCIILLLEKIEPVIQPFLPWSYHANCTHKRVVFVYTYFDEKQRKVVKMRLGNQHPDLGALTYYPELISSCCRHIPVG